jgi:uncharacterized protein YfdQ (DUF2303 family)
LERHPARWPLAVSNPTTFPQLKKGTNMSDTIEQNLAQTLAREMKTPVIFNFEDAVDMKALALPPGWTQTQIDTEKYLQAPRRKKATVAVDDADSFIEYFKRHGSLANSTIWCRTDFDKNTTTFIGIINDNGETATEAGWRDHCVVFVPRLSVEWKRWNEAAAKDGISQGAFAEFIESNRQDIAGGDGLPSGADMLDMALNFEANQDMKFKSAIRLQSGAVDMAFVQSDADQTIAKMKMFDRFNIGIPVFLGGDAYKVEGRLRYRVPGGNLKFYIDLIRTDRILNDATIGLSQKIGAGTGKVVFAGNPFANNR